MQNPICPKCNSAHIVTKDTAKTYGGIIGTAGGAISGATAALAGANIGSKIGMVAGPVGIAAGTVAGALFGALFYGATGGIAGSQLGKVVDEHVLKNLECQDCGHVFPVKNPVTSISTPSPCLKRQRNLFHLLNHDLGQA